jgi:hypothetical protein
VTAKRFFGRITAIHVAFTHQRAVLRRALWLDPPFRYPPPKLSLAGLKRAIKFLLND